MATAASSTAEKGGLSNLTGAVAMIGILSLTILPLPAFVLDILLATSICISVVVFMMAVYIDRPLDFTAFPSVLLLVTLFRLALNIATTRRVLLHGGEGIEAAGGVIRAFGQFAVGGNFVVGVVVFLILVAVNYIVITKGADRISEVSARFTLDAMPGKQMAIDADMGSGFITEREARSRRKELEQEAQFHGSMDGASKFVRGDAVAGLVIVAINVIGGMVVGMWQHDQTFVDAGRTYTLLSVGDGLVTQIPALLVSTGSALLVTRGSTQNMGLSEALASQLFSRSQPIAVAGSVLGILALVPGMPHLAFLTLAAGAGLLSRRVGAKAADLSKPDEAGKVRTPAAEANKALDPAAQKAEIEGLLPVELLSLEVGLDLLPLVDGTRAGELLSRIASLRKQMALDLGLIVPPVHIRDDLRLRPGAYRIMISGVKVAQGEIRANRLLAIDGSGSSTALNGETVKEPTFGLPAKWISPSDRARAESIGCTVVDPSAVVATHLTEVVRNHAHELLGRREAQEILDVAGKQNSKVVEELIPHLMSLGDVIKVLRALLQEGVSIRDSRTILEALADTAGQTKDPQELAELVRHRLARHITMAHINESGELRASVLDPRAEELFRGKNADAQSLSRLTTAIEEAARRASQHDEDPVLVVAPDVRRAVAAVALRYAPGMTVMSYREIDPTVPFITRGVINAKEASA